MPTVQGHLLDGPLAPRVRPPTHHQRDHPQGLALAPTAPALPLLALKQAPTAERPPGPRGDKGDRHRRPVAGRKRRPPEGRQRRPARARGPTHALLAVERVDHAPAPLRPHPLGRRGEQRAKVKARRGGLIEQFPRRGWAERRGGRCPRRGWVGVGAQGPAELTRVGGEARRGGVEPTWLW